MSTYEISKSSLLSLKAEILRKQDELTKAKITNNIKIAQHIKRNTPLDIKNKGIEKRLLNDTVEDEDLLKKSRDALEAKSKLYDKLSKSKLDDDELNKRYLVQFNKKGRNVQDYHSDSENDDINEENYESAENPDDEWVEYTDCLGRTRKCLRKDLEHIKLNDAELKQRMEGRETNRDEPEDNHENNKATDKKDKEKFDETSELLSSDMRRELLRRQWEREEEELKNKTDVHYQDILFNEARTHGVGYYQFSKDEELRRKQQESLKNLRKNTEEQQKRAQEMKKLRDKQLKARIKAAKNRRRIRMGLPPEEESNNEETIVATPEPEIIPEKQEDMEKEEARKNHIRPWDIGKQGVKEHYVHTQEEWVDKKRKERRSEFAPPTEYKTYKEDKKSLYYTTKKRRNYSSDEDDERPLKGINPYKSSRGGDKAPFTPVSIINEVGSDVDDENNDYVRRKRNKGAEIAPPDEYESSSSSNYDSKIGSGNIAQSIDAGLKFLRMQSEKKVSRAPPRDMFLD